jgi:glutathione-regulated potassium-efflux system protein KefB
LLTVAAFCPWRDAAGGARRLPLDGPAHGPAREYDEIVDEHPASSSPAAAASARSSPVSCARARPVHRAWKFGERVDLSRRFGSNIYFGDPSRPRCCAARRSRCSLLDRRSRNEHSHGAWCGAFSAPEIVARARSRQHAFRLMDLNVDDVVRGCCIRPGEAP